MCRFFPHTRYLRRRWAQPPRRAARAALQALAAAATPQLVVFPPQELTSFTWALCARLGFHDPGFALAVASTVAGQLQPAAYTPSQLGLIVWSLACTGAPVAAPVLGLAAGPLLAGVRAGAMQDHEVANVAWAYGRQGLRHEGLMAALVQHAVAQVGGRAGRLRLTTTGGSRDGLGGERGAGSQGTCSRRGVSTALGRCVSVGG
jgi:hypothetical protein